MAEVIEMIQLSPTMEEGMLVAWLKNEGEAVETGEPLAEVETDKATMEMESFFDGVLLKILIPAGSAAPIGAALGIVGEEGEDISDVLAEIEAKAAAAPEPAPATAAPAPAALPAPIAAPEPAAAPAAAPAPIGRGDGRVLSSPLARRLAAERGLDVGQIPGSGPQGRVVKRDVEGFQGVAASAPAVRLPTLGAPAQDTLVPLTQMRKAIARNLSAAWQAPSFTLTREIAMDRLMATRSEINAALAEDETGIKISVNDFVIKAAAKALIDVPEMNSAFEGDAVRLFGSADIGMAVALDGGLITPIVRQAEAKSLTHIAVEAKDLARRARDKKLQPDEFTGASFSISNLGMFGIDHFTAVLNPPAAGILAVGATKTLPVVGADGELTVGRRMNVTLTCDHRAVDGAVGARFLIRFARYMEAPSLMLAG
jgi:pyruvate dehydrogenase E2 component (dihydrolipoamide acetyltransferase)